MGVTSQPTQDEDGINDGTSP